MAIIRKIRFLILTGVCTGLLAGCATTPVSYRDLASASQLAPNPNDTDGHTPFIYAPEHVAWRRYDSFILDPVTIYSGADGQFGSTSDDDKAVLANHMQAQFVTALRKKYVVASTSGTNTLRIHVTLAGIETNTPVLSTLSKLNPVGVVLNSARTAAGTEGSFAGSVTFAVEVYDSASGRLLRSYVSKEFPWAENVGESFGTLDASRAGIRNGANDLMKQLNGTPT